MIVKIAIVAMAAIFIALPSAWPDWSYDEMRASIEKGVTYDQMKELEQKFKRKVIEGEGYVLLVKPSETINGWDVHVVDKADNMATKVLGDVCVVIPEGSTYSQRLKTLKPGTKVRFGGSVSTLFGKTIILKGSAKIE